MEPNSNMSGDYVKNYLKAHNLSLDEFIPCEICGAEAFDIHHKIHKSQGGSNEADNLIALCRLHHDKAHNL